MRTAALTAFVCAVIVPHPIRADEAAFDDKPAGESVDDLDSSLARAVEPEGREWTIFPRLKRALQHLPPFFADTELSLRFRTFYLPETNTGDETPWVWAAGGKLRYRSGWFRDTAQLGFGLYGSQKILADDPDGLTRLLQPDEKSIVVPGEAFLRLRYLDHEATFYRQELDLPYVNKRDSRMIPNTFEAYMLRGSSRDLTRLGRIDYSLGYVPRAKLRADDGFVSMSEAAGVDGSSKGMILAGVQLQPRPRFHLGVYEFFVSDTLNIAYVATDYLRDLTPEWGLRLQSSFTHQSSMGDDGVTGSAFDTWVLGGRAALSYRGATVWLGVSHTDRSEDIQSPYGTYPGALSLMQSDFNSAGETGVVLGWSYDFSRLGLESLSAFGSLALGDGARDTRPGHANFDEREIDLTMDYKIEKGRLRGLWLRVRGSLLDVQGERTGKQLRVILNYDLPIL